MSDSRDSAGNSLNESGSSVDHSTNASRSTHSPRSSHIITPVNIVNPNTITIANLRSRLDAHVQQSHSTIEHLQSGIARLLHPEDFSTLADTENSSTSGNVPIAPAFSSSTPALHNPRHLGTLPFYFPRRLQQVTDPAIIHLATPGDPPIIPGAPSTLPPDNPIRTRRFHQDTLDNGCWDDFQATCDQLQPNDLWGDNFLVKNDHTFRIYFQNLNSCGLSQGPDKWADILDSMISSECDIMNFAQTSVNWKFLRNRNAMHKPVRSRMPISKLQVSRNKFDSDQMTLPGGVAQIIKGNWTSRVVEYLQDPRLMGRWCGIKLRLKHDRNLYIFSAYRVCAQSLANIGAETAFAQQDYMLAMEGFSHPNPRRQFIQDLVDVIKELQSGLDEFLILLDANEQLGSSAHGLTYLMRECNLIDILHQHHGVCPSFSTFDSGTSRLDYAIGSSTLLPFVNQCGYLPFYQGVSSDHRGLFVDLSMDLIDGLTQLEHIPRRHLHSAFQQDVYNYKTLVNKLFLENNIFERCENLYFRSGIIQKENSSFKFDLETLDKLIVSIQLQAEIQCCKPRTQFDWSDDIHFHKIILNYWSIKRKRLTKKKNVKYVLKQIYDKLPETYRQYIDVATGCSALSNWCKIKAKLKALMAQHRKQREQLNNESIANEAAFTGSSAEQVRLKKDRQKRDKKLYTTLRQHFHPCTRSGISHLLIPDHDVHGNPTDDVEKAHTWKSETAPSVILEKLLDRNIKHFGQAQGSPFTVPPLSTTFGYDGSSYQPNCLSQEGIIPQSLNNLSGATKAVIERLSDETFRHPVANDLINFADFTTAIKKWRESTSTSPSGRHLGHYKSLIAIDSKSRYYTESNPDPGLSILKVIYQVASSAFHSGITLERWTSITTCMIEKIPGTPRINKLRIIHLYEADYNLMNKLVWQRGVVWHAHNRGTLNTAQSGSRPYRTCNETVVSKDQKYLYSQLTRTNMGTMDNDAKSCYDRVVASLALLISQQFGVPAEICQTVGETLKTMKFRLRTAMGDSSEFYHHTEQTPVHGVGQGGTASPAFWLLISSALFDCHQKVAAGMVMTDPTQTISLRQWLEAIVDDTSIFTNSTESQLPEDLVRALEKDAQYWENLLSVSGGCLELSKCFYYLLAWTFSANGDPIPMSLPEIAAVTSSVQIQEMGKPVSTAINIKSPEVAHKTLGVYKSMTGNETDQIKSLTQRSNNMSSIVATSGLKPHQADVALRMIYTPAMGYSLPAVNIPARKLNKIQAKALESFVPALGYNHGFPRDVLFGPREYGGEGIPHLHTESQIQKIEIIIANIRSNTDLGKLLSININYIQLIIGRIEPFLSSHYDIPYIDNWFMGVRNFLREINGKLYIKNIYVPKLSRQGDVCIMERMAQASPKLSGNQIRYINNWRIHYQVQTLSDLCNAKGDQIDDTYLHCPTLPHINMSRTDRQSILLWPIQPPPTSKATFQLWTRYLRKCFLGTSGKKLVTPLGKWILPLNESQSVWRYYYSELRQSLLIRTATGFQCFSHKTKSTPGTTTFAKNSWEILADITDDYVPIDITETNDTYTACHSSRGSRQPPTSSSAQPSLPTTLEQAIQQLPSWQTPLLQHFRIHDIDALLDTLVNPDIKLYMATDGGMKDQRGSFGVSVGTQFQELFRIEGPVCGYDEHSNSFRSEAFGMMAGLSFLSLLIKFYTLTFPLPRKIHVFCDNLSLVRWVQKIIGHETYPRMYLRSESDAILQIEYAIMSLQTAGIIIVLDHVKGHQDDHHPYDQLSREAQLNILADEYATNYLLEGDIPCYSEITSNPISLYINDNVITRKLKKEMRNASRSPDLRAFMIIKFSWHENIPDTIWWSAHGSTIKTYNSYDQRRIRKFIFGWLPTSERLFRQHTVISDRCPSCGDVTETHAHLIRCNCASRIDIKSKWMESLDLFLSNVKYTPSIIRTIFKDHIDVICTPDKSLSYHTSNPQILAAINDQQQIGWHHIMRGRLAFRWGIIISNHLAANNVDEKEMSAIIWGRTIIRYVFDLMLLLWKKRNDDGHQLTRNKDSALTRERLLLRIAAFKTSNPPISHHHHDFIYRSDDILNLYTVSNLRSWFRMAENLVNMHKKQQRRQAPADISTFWSTNLCQFVLTLDGPHLQPLQARLAAEAKLPQQRQLHDVPDTQADSSSSATAAEVGLNPPSAVEAPISFVSPSGLLISTDSYWGPHLDALLTKGDVAALQPDVKYTEAQESSFGNILEFGSQTETGLSQQESASIPPLS